MTDPPGTKPDVTATPPKLGEIVSSLGLAVVLLTSWLYVTGWVYAYHYFSYFSIPLLMVDVPYHSYIVYGSLVIWKNYIWSISICLLFLLFNLFPRFWEFGKFTIFYAVFSCIFLLFVIGHIGAVDTAKREFAALRHGDFEFFSRVSIVLRPGALKAVGERLGDIPSSSCGRMVLLNGNWIFLIRPIQGAPDATLDTIILSMDQVEAIRVMPSQQSCP